MIQWHWVDQTNVTRHPWRQWNSIHDRLVGWEAADGEPANPGAWRRNIDKLREARHLAAGEAQDLLRVRDVRDAPARTG